MQKLSIGPYTVDNHSPFTLIAGPCAIESEEVCLQVAEKLQDLRERHNIQIIFKASYDKANRTSIDSFRGVGLNEGLRILENVRKKTSLPIITDVHTPEEATACGEVVDILQIPALLCRQTDLLVAAGKTNKPINLKKGQFLAPWDIKHPLEKLLSTGNKQILLMERGTTFGYNNLVSDMRSIPIMQELGYPVFFDASHSVQLPGGKFSCSGGQIEYLPALSLAAIGAGANGIYIETHPNPQKALCDGPSSYPLEQLEELVKKMAKLYQAYKED